jgi:hypothetical protein
MMTAVTFAPETFFETLLPAMLAEKREAAARLDRVVQFYIMGERDRAWFADLTGEPEVQEGEHEAPDLCIAIRDHLVLELAAGTLDVEKALAEEDLQLLGDVEVLQGLADIFSAGLSGMDVMYASVRRPPR